MTHYRRLSVDFVRAGARVTACGLSLCALALVQAQASWNDIKSVGMYDHH